MGNLPKITFGTICTGIGGFDLGFERAGMECKFMVEIDRSCQTVLRKRFPNAKIYEDIKAENQLERVNVLAGGTTCQGFSITGLRKGLGDDRSNLCLRYVEIADELSPDIVVWENVPGCLSLQDNAFGCFIGALVGLDSPLVHPDTENFKAWWRDGQCAETGDFRFPVWPSAGMVVGPKRTACWRVLDSQYLGVAQRRERVFVIADTLGGRSAKILFESEMLRRHSAPSRQTREELAGTLGASPKGSGWRSDTERMTFIPTHDVSPCLQERGHKGADSDITQAHVITPPLTQSPYGDNPSREQLLQVVGFDKGNAEFTGNELAGTLRCNRGKRKGVNDGKSDNQCVAFQPGNLTAGRGSPPDPEVVPTLRSENDGDTKQCVAFSENQRGEVRETDYARQLTAGGGKPGQGFPAARVGYRVRRLVPIECERLQGFPDNWTLEGVMPNQVVISQKDSPRYRQVGNAVTVNVAEWIGRRIRKFGYPNEH